VEVGLVGSTLSAGKPRTWGSDERDAPWQGNMSPTQRGNQYDNKTDQGSGEGAIRPHAAIHLARTSTHSGIAPGDMADDEQAGRRGSG